MMGAGASCGGSTSGGDGTGGGAGVAGHGGSGATAGSAQGGTGGLGGTDAAAGAGGTGAATDAGAVPPGWRACDDTSECAVRARACCPGCGPMSVDQAIAVHRDFLDDAAERACGPNPESCPDVLCEVAPTWVLPFCASGECIAIDIRTDLLTSCGTAAQCRLRWGTTCCESCSESPGLLVAVNSQVDYDRTVCGEVSGCPPCAPPPYPPDARAECGPDHHCRVAVDP